MEARIADTGNNFNVILSDETRRIWFRKFRPTIEPTVFLLCVGSALQDAITTNLFLVHTCEVSLGFNHSVCQGLGDKTFKNETLESMVQLRATYFTMGKASIEAFIPAILSFFIGPWSDLNGRKPLIMWPIIGHAFSYILLLVASTFNNLSPMVLMFLTLPMALCGGFICFISGSYSFISDISTSSNTALRMGILDIVLFSGMFVGNFLSSYIYGAAGKMGYAGVYGCAALCCLVGCIYCGLFVNESVNNDQSEYPYCCLSSGLFKIHFIKDMCNTSCAKRSDYKRSAIFMIVFTLVTSICTIYGESSVLFYFTREKFGFDLHDYTIFTSVSIILIILGIGIGAYIFPKLISSLPILGMIGYFCKAVGSVVCALSPKSWYMYIGILISLPGAAIGAWSRAILSRSVQQDEIGKVFSFVASLEAIVPLIAPVIYTSFYDSTFRTFYGAFFILSAGIFSLDFFLFLGVAIIQYRNTIIYSNINSEEEQIESEEEETNEEKEQKVKDT